MTIELTHETETLAQKAAITLGYTSVAAFIEQAIRDKAESVTKTDDVVDADQQIEALRAFAQSHAPVSHFVDDSRDSIYPDRI
mgnify:FL=1|jgi:uncharacterized protein (DUF1778 family)